MKIEVSFWAAAESDGLQQYYDLHSQCPVVCAKTPRTFEPFLMTCPHESQDKSHLPNHKNKTDNLKEMFSRECVVFLQHALNLSERRRGPVSC
jgi:hypothetical protein